jgi:hypothetical protein
MGYESYALRGMLNLPRLAVSDEQFASIVDAAKLLPPRMRSRFLTDVTSRLVVDRGPRSLVNNVDVSRAINLVLRELQVAG